MDILFVWIWFFCWGSIWFLWASRQSNPKVKEKLFNSCYSSLKNVETGSWSCMIFLCVGLDYCSWSVLYHDRVPLCTYGKYLHYDWKSNSCSFGLRASSEQEEPGSTSPERNSETMGARICKKALVFRKRNLYFIFLILEHNYYNYFMCYGNDGSCRRLLCQGAIGLCCWGIITDSSRYPECAIRSILHMSSVAKEDDFFISMPTQSHVLSMHTCPPRKSWELVLFCGDLLLLSDV